MASDSIDKIVIGYFAKLTKSPFTYKNKTYIPKNLRVSPDIFRGYTCPAKCGGCCPKFSLDYLPFEEKPYDLIERYIDINGKKYKIWSDLQEENLSAKCKNLNRETGRCNIHKKHPFSCDFELIRFLQFEKSSRPNQLTTRLFGRGWKMTRISGERGALCEILPITDETKKDVMRKIQRLKMWCEYFEIDHCVDEIIYWGLTNPVNPLIIYNEIPTII